MDVEELKIVFEEYKEVKNKEIDEIILKTLNEFEWFQEKEFIERYNTNNSIELIHYNEKIIKMREKLKKLLEEGVILKK
jgi:hypothetical protein